jgi:hypothetical protein
MLEKMKTVPLDCVQFFNSYPDAEMTLSLNIGDRKESIRIAIAQEQFVS